MIKAFALIITGVCLLGTAMTHKAMADEVMPDSNHGRYIFSKLADGFLRLDTQTGEVSVCSERTIGFACQASPEDRAVLENEIARLRRENGALKQEILAHGLPLPAGAMPEPQSAQDRDIIVRLPDETQIDRVTAFLGRVWQRFVEAVANAQKQMLHKS